MAEMAGGPGRNAPFLLFRGRRCGALEDAPGERRGEQQGQQQQAESSPPAAETRQGAGLQSAEKQIDLGFGQEHSHPSRLPPSV